MCPPYCRHLHTPLRGRAPRSPPPGAKSRARRPGVMGGALFPQEDMRLALDEGRSVLESIREPLARGPEQSPNQDQLDSQSTVQR